MKKIKEKTIYFFKNYFNNYGSYLKAKIKSFIEMVKKSYKSWTINVNLFIISLIPFLPEIEDNFHIFQGVLSENVYQYLLLGIAVANIVLRFKTSNSLKDK